MANKRRTAKKAVRPFTDGYAYEFHGAYSKRSAANAKRDKLRAAGHKRVTVGARVGFNGASTMRYVVMIPRDGSVPF